MESFVIPLVFTGIIFFVLIGLLFFWLYKDNESKILGCVACRKYFMKHKKLDDTGIMQKPLMYQRKPEQLTVIGSNDLTCPCQRFRHVTEQGPNVSHMTQMSDIPLGDTQTTWNAQNDVTNGDIQCDVIIDDCERCHGCKCAPITMYKHPERSMSDDSTGDTETPLNLTPEITFVKCKGCQCGCAVEKEQV